MMDPVSSLVQAISQSRALDGAQLEELSRLVPRFPGDPRGLAGELLKRQWLTPFQINRLNAGRGSELLLGSYVLLERLGEGGMGQVFKARNWKLGRVVAVKLIRKDMLTNELVVARFRREIETSAQFDHPNIIRGLDADESDGNLFIVMEYVEGVDLGRLVKEQGPVPPDRACEYIRQASLGLQYAHERGFVHRDVKPPNLLLANQGEVIKLLDLGLARLQESNENQPLTNQPALTQMGLILGTVDFIAPEQARDSRKVDGRADLYSLGCTLHYLITGRVPYPGGTPTERLIKHNFDPLPSLFEVAPPLRAIIHRLLAKKPEDRYPTASELAQALEQLLVHPERMRVRPVHLVETEPSLHLPPGRSPAPAPTQPLAVATAERKSRSAPRSAGKKPAGSRARDKTSTPRRDPSRPTPPPRLPVAQVLTSPATAPIITPRVSPRRRSGSRVVWGLFAAAILGGVLAVPILFPAAATQGDTVPQGNPQSQPAKEPIEQPRPWDGVVREFLVVGPLGRDSGLVSAVEKNPVSTATYGGPLAEEQWKPWKVEESGALKVSGGMLRRPLTLFAQVQIHSPNNRKVKLLTSSGDLVRIRLNGELVHERSSLRLQPRPEEDQLEASLKAGWNTVLVRLGARGLRPFEFYLGFQDAAGLRPSLHATRD